MKSLWILLVVTAFAVPACKKGGETCEKFVERSMTCGDDDVTKMTSTEKSQFKLMMEGMCEGAFSNEVGGAEGDTKKMMLGMYATLRTKATCVAAAKDCAAAKACDKLDN